VFHMYEHFIVRAFRHANGKFPARIRIRIPLEFFIAFQPDAHSYAGICHGLFIKHRPQNHERRNLILGLVGGRLSCGWRVLRRRSCLFRRQRRDRLLRLLSRCWQAKAKPTRQKQGRKSQRLRGVQGESFHFALDDGGARGRCMRSTTGALTPRLRRLPRRR
jgi:hypothetical protein